MTALHTHLPQDRLRVETGEQLTQTSSLIGAAGLVLQEGNLSSPRNCWVWSSPH